jgi:hypothetical protein
MPYWSALSIASASALSRHCRRPDSDRRPMQGDVLAGFTSRSSNLFNSASFMMTVRSQWASNRSFTLGPITWSRRMP